MRPLKIEFQAFGPYAGYEKVDFETIAEKGLFLICGKTGMGKTMLLDAITFALYGKSSGNGRNDFESMRCTNADFDKITFVKFEFENNGEYYVFERRLERKRVKLFASYNLMRKDEDGVFRPLLENAKEKALTEKAVELIGLDYEQFRQVIILPQGQFEKLLTSNSDEKEKILTSIFGEERWQLIANNMYEAANARKEELKYKKNKIQASLMEEQCETMADLDLVILHKQNEIKELEDNFRTADYEKQLKEMQAVLALVNRFKDLHKAEAKVAELESQKDAIALVDKKVTDAERAEKVRTLIEAEDSASKEYAKRVTAEKAARDLALRTREEVKAASASLAKHVETEPQVEAKKTLKIQYETKRADYENLDSVVADLRAKQQAERAAKAQEASAEEAYKAYAPRIVNLNASYLELESEHKTLLEQYLAGITGELAEKLTEGSPCPVCGSTSHPRKAVKADDSVTKQMVDAKNGEKDSKYDELQKTIGQQEEAKKVLDEKHAITVERNKDVVALEAKLAEMQAGMVEGITSLKDLDSAIKALDTEIKAFAETKETLEQKEKAAKEKHTEALAKIDPAAQETINAEAMLKTATTATEAGLKENRFDCVEDAKALLLDATEVERLKSKSRDYVAGVKVAKQNLEDLKTELADKEEPDEAVCLEKIEQAENAKSEFAKNKGILSANLEHLVNKKTMLEAEGEGIEEQIRDAEEDYAFALKLRGDTGIGLQRYVLGIMFSSVVTAANKMLELVHGGRYTLYRTEDSNGTGKKKGLELKVTDKYSEEHEGRFVNTLSGGEKFLVSLALSIGMSTVAQKSGIKIEALFIDEGFGSLDEDSIGDAMDILDSIQKANGLVGIISHVQILQDRIPTKLRVEKVDRGSHIVQTIG